MELTYGNGQDLTPEELRGFYTALHHDVAPTPEQVREMLANSVAVVTARDGENLIGIARGVCDGVRGYLAECKLDARYQGPAAVTRTDGRVEHDKLGIAAEMARRVLEAMAAKGVQRIDCLAYGTEVDFVEELGFKRKAGLVGLSLMIGAATSNAATSGASAGLP